MIKHKYLVAVVCQQKISSIQMHKGIHEFPYTDEVIGKFKEVAISHTMDNDTFVLSITYLGEFDE